MRHHPKLCSVLLFIVAVFAFLLSELYFFMNPMFYESDFILLYHAPILLCLLVAATTVGLYRIDHAYARRLLFALACGVCVFTIGVNVWVFAALVSNAAIYCLYNLSLWLSVPMLIFSVFTSCLACRKNRKAWPRACCVLLFAAALCFFLLSISSLFTNALVASDFAESYLGPLLLGLAAFAEAVELRRIRRALRRGEREQ